MKTLKTLQVIAKIGRILSTIVFVCCVVGAALSAIGIVCLAVIPEGFQIGEVTVRGLVEQKAGVSLTTCCMTMAQAVVFCAGEAVLAKFAERYFKNELKAGTPFTFDGAKELMRLGILAICISIGTAIIAGLVYVIFKVAAKDVAEPSFHNGASVGIGVMMIVGSLLCKHGAEASAKPEEQQAA